MWSAAQAISDVSESHGALCGVLAAQGYWTVNEWIKTVFDEYDDSDSAVRECTNVMSRLIQHTMEKLNGSDLAFELLLPDSEASMTVRVDALANWCQGFVHGLALGGIKEDQHLPEEIREIIKDFLEISCVSATDDDQNENTEADYFEIVEYVRVGVLLINETLQPCQAPRQLQ